MKPAHRTGLVCLALTACATTAHAQEESHPASSSTEFNQSFEAAIKQLQQRDFGDDLSGPPGLLQESESEGRVGAVGCHRLLG